MGTVAMGEIGLAGELRRVRDLPQRLAEAARLGFAYALVPSDRTGGAPTGPTSGRKRMVDGMQVIEVPNIGTAMSMLGFSGRVDTGHRSEAHTSELQSLMRISYAVICLKQKKQT